MCFWNIKILKYNNRDLTVLEETNIAGVLTEALTAKIKTVLADEGRALSADTAINWMEVVEWKDHINYSSIYWYGKKKSVFNDKVQVPIKIQ